MVSWGVLYFLIIKTLFGFATKFLRFDSKINLSTYYYFIYILTHSRGNCSSIHSTNFASFIAYKAIVFSVAISSLTGNYSIS